MKLSTSRLYVFFPQSSPTTKISTFNSLHPDRGAGWGNGARYYGGGGINVNLGWPNGGWGNGGWGNVLPGSFINW